jgi:hypothetical protein
MNKMFIDDERFPPGNGEGWLICRDFGMVKRYVEFNGIPDHISFDHDLGDGKETGFDIAKYLVECDLDGIHTFPDNFSFYVHSMNPIGKVNIQSLLDSYLSQR